ncbi:MAG: hypothetical protein JRH01_19905 [Deltaproteobacteria bacterium]|nr:hypothetical protein [Deltaproteobacteria bacterium]MBW2397038.1 hypothetical protein [Deltaproteobacteria bacterium]
MKAYQVFARMSPELATELLERIRESTPAAYTQALAAAGAVMKARPRFIMKLAPERRAQMVRRALARVAASGLAEEILATYFLESRMELLTEWLDLLEIEHEEGSLKEEHPECPPEAALAKAIETFRAAGPDDPDRDLLIEAFAAQSAVDWPVLDGLIGV